MTTGGARCAVCGEEHEELEPAFKRPDAVFAVPQAERGARVRQTEDFVSIDDEAFFIRCIAPIPVAGRAVPYSWGFWVKVSRSHFEEYRGYFSVDPPADHPGFEGTLANQTQLLPPTLGLPAHVHLGRGTQRPRLMLLGEGHPLTREQEQGITEADARAWAGRVRHAHGPGASLDPPAPVFTATLEQQGWRVAEPAEAGRVALRLERPPSAGDLVKAPFQFLAADARGRVGARTELMWVRLDEVRADGWWSGTLDNIPFVPGTLGFGTRVWLRPGQVIAHDVPHAPAEPAEAPPPPPGLLARLRRWLGGDR